MEKPVLEISHLSKTFRQHGNRTFKALDDVSLFVNEDECVGIVGESGCGKSTLAKLVTGLLAPDSGEICFCGNMLGRKATAKDRKGMNMIFQEPRSSFDPRLTLGTSIMDALVSGKLTKAEKEAELFRLLKVVGLEPRFASAYPRQVSGGECQRAAIARAIAQKPRLLICDEATSALDVSVQAQIIELLNNIRKEQHIAYLFISHDLALVSSFCDRTYVIYQGKIVESGITSQIISDPREAYTKRLISSVLTVD